MYVPKLKYGLISISKLSEQGFSAFFTKNNVVIKDRRNIIRMIGTKKNGLYELTYIKEKEVCREDPELPNVNYDTVVKEDNIKAYEIRGEKSSDKFLFDSGRVVNIDEHENQDNLERIRNHGKNNFLLNLIKESDINIKSKDKET
jgi:hypothetical protein